MASDPLPPTEDQDIPLCVDLDGTLLRTDLLAESLLSLLLTQPRSAFSLPGWLLRGRAALKRRIAERVVPDPARLPYNPLLLERLRAEKAKGRKLILVTASDMNAARPVADHLRLFSEVMASDGAVNLKGEAKARALTERFGRAGFEYAGDCRADLPVWRAARRAILVDAPESLAAEVSALLPTRRISSGRRGRLFETLRAMRIHQWGKNLIIFMPLITAHRLLDTSILGSTILATIAFSFCASSVYLLNDLVDLQSDRVMPGKKDRPFASGTLPLAWAPMLILPLLAAAAAIAAVLPLNFRLVLIGYYAVTLLYCLCLRSLVIWDVFCLAILYTIRLLAGHEVTGIKYSPWLFSFAMFLFLSLALMKRFVELSRPHAAVESGHGRGYARSDAAIMREMGVTSGYVAALIFALYIHSSQVETLYSKPALLWPLCFIILFAISRMWFLAQRGELDDDPVLFVLKDAASYVCVALMFVVLAAASSGVPAP